MAVKPGRAVRGSRSGRPIMALLDLLGRRWVLRIVWELRGGRLGFNELQARCDGMSPSVLNLRLADLREAGVVAVAEDRGYELTREGDALIRALGALDAWAQRWAARGAGPAPAAKTASRQAGRRQRTTMASSASSPSKSSSRSVAGSQSPSPGSSRTRRSAVSGASRR
jgi:DNA-binding HxlR family transcriptional regulator